MNLLERCNYHKISGIYSISNTQDDRIYIGSTISFYDRNIHHINQLKINKHGNIKLQRFVNKYGIDKLVFNIIEFVEDIDLLLLREQYYLDLLKPYENGFNIAKDAERPTLGLEASDETKRKIGEKSKNRFFSKETRNKMALNMINRNCKGENNNNLSKLKTTEVILIKKMLNSKFGLTEISKHFNVNFRTIGNIKSGLRWKHVVINDKLTNDEYSYYDNIFKCNTSVRKNSVLTKDDVSYIKYLMSINFIKDKYDKRIITIFFNVSRANLNNIITNKNHKLIKSEKIIEIDINFNKFLNEKGA